MRQKLATLVAIFLAASLVITVKATYTLSDGIDGYVYGNGMPVEGITVYVYNSSDMLEGYSVEAGNTQGTLGTDVTDVNGYFHIAWLYAHGTTYKVVAVTPVGNLTQYTTVNCGSTVRLCFNYSYGGEPFTIGYWKNHLENWPVSELTIGGVTLDTTALMNILWNANSKDATSMLAAQLIGAKLNVANGASASTEVLDAIEDADDFLEMHPLGSNPRGADREYALMLKDTLDYFNNGY
jgi:hypothetical protein